MVQFSLRIVEEAHIGNRKKEQQDFHGHLFIPAEPEKGIAPCCLMAVADGVSMGMAGALASRTAVETLLTEFSQLYLIDRMESSFALEQAFTRANRDVYRLARDRPGMATTMVAALIIGDQLITAHIGDTRVYLERPGQGLQAISIDHSWVTEFGEQMVRKGQMTAKELLMDNRRHGITRALGLEEDVLIDFNARTLQDGDLILLCSDGVWDMIGADKLRNLVFNSITVVRESREQEKFNHFCHRIVEEALRAGGRDNITVAMSVVDNIGAHVPLPGLARLLERTAEDLEIRLNPMAEIATQEVEQGTLGAIPYRPIGTRDEPAVAVEAVQEKVPLPQFDTMVSRGQQFFALGQWEEGLNELLLVEKLNPGYHGLFETLSALIIRYIGSAIADGEERKARKLHRRLVEEGITRYDGVIFDYCLEEGRKASTEYNYKFCRDYAMFAADLMPADQRPKQLIEMSELYLELEKPEQPVAQKLAIAQKLYARDPSFGAIQDDLAAVYMQLGDDATTARQDEDAVAWYEMIRSLRPREMRLVSLANTKLRALEDARARRAARDVANANSNVPIPNGLEKFAASNSTNAEGKPETEAISRLKDRVSRAQKAWDNGRREVGAEYIYLVDQLNQLLSPNPWQPTFPRVCYDYGKWLLEQRQYAESKPYFLKAQALGLTAAQQRLSEIDRIERESRPGSRGAPPVDLPDSAYAPNRANGNNPSPAVRTPFISMPPETPETNVSPGKILSEEANLPSPAAATPNPDQAQFSYIPPKAPAGYSGSPTAAQAGGKGKNETLVGVSGSNRNTGADDRLQNAAMREARRVGNAPSPQNLDRMSGTLQPAGPTTWRDLVIRYWLPVVVSLVVVVVALFILINVISRLGQNSDASKTVIAATIPATATTAAATNATNATRSPVNVVLEGVKADAVQVWLAAPSESRASWREFSTNAAGNFQLMRTDVTLLSPSIKYTVVVTPRDTATQKYKKDVPLDAPIQTLFAKGDQSPGTNGELSVNLKIPAESLNFYPLEGSDTDTTLPEGSRYIAATRHILRGEFLKYYDTNGGIGRFGFPISEDFDWAEGGRVQFFQRGWLVQGQNDKLVKLGKLGSDTLAITNCDAIPKPPSSVGSAAPKIDAAFTAYQKANLSIGQPLSTSFEVSEGNTKKKVQYFEFARLETSSTDTKVINLGLLGSEYSRCKNWYR